MTEPIAAESSDPSSREPMPFTLPAGVRRPAFFLGASLILAGLFEWWLTDDDVGIGWPLFFTAFVIALGVLAVVAGQRPRPANAWLPLLLLFFAVMLAVRTSDTLVAFNVLAILGLGALSVFYFAAGSVWNGAKLPTLALIPIRAGVNAMILGAPVLREFYRERRRATENDSDDISSTPGTSYAVPIFRGVLLAAPVLLVFGLLLSSADAIFADVLGRVFSVELIEWFFENLGRGLRVLIAAFFLSGALAYAVLRRPHTPDESPVERELAGLSKIVYNGFIEGATILALVNVLFLIFVGIQIQHFFGGEAYVQKMLVERSEFTYAEYGRRGFWELLTASILSLMMLTALRWSTRRETPRRHIIFSALCSLTIALVLVMLFSAFHRMSLYEEAYGYTELRLIVFVFMGALAYVLLFFTLTLWLRSFENAFGFALITGAAVFVGTLNLINPDALIVERNFARYERDLAAGSPATLDAYYLTTLSDDALPALVRVYNKLEDASPNSPKLTIGGHLLVRYQTYVQPDDGPWYTFHFGRNAARRALDDYHLP